MQKKEMVNKKERPMLFSGLMVLAILAGNKTQTRRVVKNIPHGDHHGTDIMDWPLSYCKTESSGRHFLAVQTDVDDNDRKEIFCPYGQVGDKLWVRETWQTHCDQDHLSPRDLDHNSAIQYPATYDGWVSKKRPSIFMPRWASRILLEITSISVERLHDISVEDAKAEGIEPIHWPDLSIKYPDYVSKTKGRRITNLFPKQSYFTLWESINGRKSLESNPWVWVVEFKRVEVRDEI